MSFSIINPTSQQEKTSCVPYRRGTFGLSGSDPELNLRERLAEPGREADQRKGWESGCGSLRMRSPPPSLGLGWPEDVPWSQKEPRTHVVSLAGAAALCPSYAPLPRASGGPGDIPLGWLRALRCLNKRWLRTGRWELLPGEGRASVRRGDARQARGGPPREPGSQKAETWAGCVVGGSLLCLPVVGGNHSRHRGLDRPPRGAHPLSCLGSLGPSWFVCA